MRIIPFIATFVVAVGLCIALSMPMAGIPPLGSFLSPQHGFWQNAEPAGTPPSLNFDFPELKDKVDVYLDERLVPHVFAQNDEDLYFVQGYLHAKYRLWQMEFQTHAAAGRLSEVLGPGPNNGYLNYDRNMRRVGMLYGARNSLAEMEKDEITKKVMDAYTAGVNAYIEQMPTRDLPLEYRLLNYLPEHWSNLKTALFLKYMSYDLTSSENDIEYTNVRNVLSHEDFEMLYPVSPDSLEPIVPKGTVFPAPLVKPAPPISANSQYFLYTAATPIPFEKPDRNNGSNNWAVNGSKTKSRRPILCNDPHLGLSLPSIWYEMQLHTPTHSVYGASFPGSPAVIIGFNDNCSWGVTNGSRDVKDYFNIRFKDSSKQEYALNGGYEKTRLEVDVYKVKGRKPFYDTVAYTVFGPVQYDASFTGNGRTSEFSNLAVRWKAHDASNELKTFYLLNRMKGYDEYLEAIKTFTCPAQNFVFASKNNDIAIWQQGKFPAKWRRQGDFIMPGTDTSYLWQSYIPQENNPHAMNPERGFVSSANQLATDTTYPYYQGGSFELYRGISINRYLRQMQEATIDDMKRMQTDNYNVFAETALPKLLASLTITDLDDNEKKYLEILRKWNFRNDAHERAPTIFDSWFDQLEKDVWNDELESANKPLLLPENFTLLKWLNNPAFKFIDNVKTPQKETDREIVTKAFKKVTSTLSVEELHNGLVWSDYKDAGIRHLLRLEPFSRFHLTTGGGAFIINATKQYHGPSWRMIVELTDSTEAWGIYPGGQSGNPGSAYYDNFVDDWAAGKYNRLWMMTEKEIHDKRIITRLHFE